MRRVHTYADGGKVTKDHMQEKPKAPPKKPKPELLGSGMASKAAKSLRDTRKRQMEELGLRDGGKVKRKC